MSEDANHPWLKSYPDNVDWYAPLEGRPLFELLDELDEIVVKYGGRIYLTKDVRVSKEVFEKGYPQIDKFREYRKKNKMGEKFNSLQSKRVEI